MDQRPGRKKERPESTPLDPGEGEPIERAGPPDSGGGQGSFTRPADVTEVSGGDEREPERSAPDLHWSPRTGAQRRPREEGGS